MNNAQTHFQNELKSKTSPSIMYIAYRDTNIYGETTILNDPFSIYQVTWYQNTTSQLKSMNADYYPY